jgi:hypothetical protein
MNNQMTNFKAEAISDDAMRMMAPSIFAPHPMLGLSMRYAFVPTSVIVAGLRGKDWLPVDVEQQHVRSQARLGFQKHLIRFRRAEQMQSLDEWNAELVLTNSHDAGCAYLLQVGIFRRLCSNGLVVSTDTFETIRFRHAGLLASEVIYASYHILEYIPKIGALIDRFRNRQLSETESLAFAQRALLLRYVTPEQFPVEPQTLLTPRRPEDQSRDLWTVFNILQENLIRGGLSDHHRDRKGHLRSVRALRGIDSKITLNKELWSLAERTVTGLN